MQVFKLCTRTYLPIAQYRQPLHHNASWQKYVQIHESTRSTSTLVHTTPPQKACTVENPQQAEWMKKIPKVGERRN